MKIKATFMPVLLTLVCASLSQGQTKSTTNSVDSTPIGKSQCRSDAQKWTYDPSDKEDPRSRFVGLFLIVNGQGRSMPLATSHLPIGQLLDRISEMSTCIRADADFERQFSTYSQMSNQYTTEQIVRYQSFIFRHNLYEQFVKEDTAENKQ